MKSLRQYIRKILLIEGMKTETDLPDGIGIEISTDRKDYAYVGYCVVDENGNHMQSLSPGLEIAENTILARNYPKPLPEEFQHPSGIYGTIAIEKLSSWGDPDCDGAFIVVNSIATPGYGPLLYDVAIEYASILGSGLVSDRYNVSAAAKQVWAKYAARDDVENFQCDDENNTLTRVNRDNLEQAAAQKLYPAPPANNFTKSPLSKRYSKEPTRMASLKALRKLVIQE